MTVDWYRNKPRVRAIIALKYTDSNVEMLNIIKNVVGGRVVKEKKYIVWVCGNRKDIEYIFTLFDKYPFLTFKRRIQFSFAKFSHTYTDRSLFELDRKKKYANKELVRSQSIPLDLNSIPYFKGWLSGFIEAKGNFS